MEAGSDFEIAHVLCSDIVGYSKLMIDEQTERLEVFNELVRQTSEFQRAEAAGKLLRIPTGDGMVLVFFTNPQAPVDCAVQLAQALKTHPEIPLRIGVHSGPVNRVQDVNGRLNVAGAGINFGQRVMDCGDAGHILLSKRVAEDLAHFSRWRPHLHELGECEVKHGVKMDIVNFYTDEVGNPDAPGKFQRAVVNQPAPPRRFPWLVGAVAVLLLAFGLGWWKLAPHKTANNAASDAPFNSLAVKPLENLSGDASKDYFADGMTDELTNKLSQIHALKRVVSRSTMMKYKGSKKSGSEIAHEIDVRAMVEGSVVLSGDQVHIAVQLVDAATGDLRWAKDYTQGLANIVQLQDRVTMAIAQAIALHLTPGEESRLSTARVVDPEAYQLYLRAKAGAKDTPANCEVAIGLLERAVELDPSFAEGFAALSQAYQDKGYFFDTDTIWLTKAEQAAATALKLNPELPAARAIHAMLLWTPAHNFQHAEAITELRHAIAIAPNYAGAHPELGAIYFHVGLFEEAAAEFEIVEKLAPSETPRFHLGVIQMYEGHYQEAETLIAANRNGFVPAFVEYNLALSLYYEGKTTEARASIDHAVEKIRDSSGLLPATQGFFAAAAGDKARALERIAGALKADKNFGHFHHTAYTLAMTYAALHDNAEAIRWLRYAADHGFPALSWFERDPALAPLRNDPAFADLLREMRPRFDRLKALADAPLGVAVR